MRERNLRITYSRALSRSVRRPWTATTGCFAKSPPDPDVPTPDPDELAPKSPPGVGVLAAGLDEIAPKSPPGAGVPAAGLDELAPKSPPGAGDDPPGADDDPPNRVDMVLVWELKISSMFRIICRR